MDQDLCVHCERCLKACKNKAIYFENGVRLVDYSKCKSCLGCVLVCPRNAIEVSSVVADQVLTVKIDHDKCNMCFKCVDGNSKFCPNDLFYIDKVKKNGKKVDRIKFKFKEIVKCQGCLKCQFSCTENAIKPLKFEA
ncbi:MAG: 4Fe-4S dicluster domain-containing protein [Promethearchaeota archaeon]